MWLTMILRNWQLALIALLSFALIASPLYGRVLKAELGEKTAVIDYMRRVATEYSERSEQTAKETSDAFTTLVEQIKGQDTALKNARAKFGSCNVAGGITRFDGLLTYKDGVGEAYVPSSPSQPHLSESVAVSPDFINACAADAAFVGAVQQWRIANALPISKE